jgi:UDP-N-acetylmuramoylalanine--D-glutamate ligase
MKYDIVILGSGESGVGAALLAKQNGKSVFVSDRGVLQDNYKLELIAAEIPFEQGQHTLEIIMSAGEIIKSPGIPDHVSMIQEIRSKKIKIISEIEFAFRYVNTSKIVAITGSNGKTTTTNLIYHIFKTAKYSVAMVGNVGYSFARQIATNPVDWYIIEVSSFQLDDIHAFKPNIAILLNITPDHLDRYQYQFSNYIASKFRIAMNQTSEDYFIINADDESIINYLPNLKSNPQILNFTMHTPNNNDSNAYQDNFAMIVDANGELMSMPIKDLGIQGKHNTANSMASGICARIADIRSEKIKEALSTFKSIEHRLESVSSVKGIEFINDSKATNMNSVWYALESMTKPTVLIIGGVDKGNDYSEISELVSEKVKTIICLGTNNARIHEAFGNMGILMVDTISMQEAVRIAFEKAESGDAVLLSPACASFDLFKNFEDRGMQFKQFVKAL